MKFKAYNKVITAVVGALIGWSQLVVGSSEVAITANEWTVLAVGLATALGVYSVTNSPIESK